MWFFVDSQGVQKGPMPETVLINLLKTSVGAGITMRGQAQCWTQGMEGWSAMREVAAFKDTVALYHETYWYVNKSSDGGGAAGEAVPTIVLLGWYKGGELTRESLVHNKDVTGDAWVKLCDIKHEILHEALDEADDVQNLQELQRKQSEQEQGQGQGQKHAKEGHRDGDGDGIKGRDGSKEAATCGFAEDRDARVAGEDSGGAQTQGHGKKRKRKKKGNWVYVEGLPADVTEDELKKHFSLVGLIGIDVTTQQAKIKIYRSKDRPEDCKGDASVCYHALASVEMALNILDGGFIRPGMPIKVSRATFDRDVGEHDASSSAGAPPPPAKMVRAGDTKKVQEARNKLARAALRQALSWDDDTEGDSQQGGAHILCIVILENMFDPKDFENPSFSDELEEDVANGCGASGAIEKITVFSKHPDGVVAVKFKSANAAADCVSKMNGRFFGGRKLRASFWDRVTDYTSVKDVAVVQREEQEEEQRHEEFAQWLEGKEGGAVQGEGGGEDDDDLPEELRLQVET